jgi:hypothetical protein
MKVRVEYNTTQQDHEQPVTFWLGERACQVEEILDQWYGQIDTYYKVRADDQHFYILRHHGPHANDEWTLEAFRENRS